MKGVDVLKVAHAPGQSFKLLLLCIQFGHDGMAFTESTLKVHLYMKLLHQEMNKRDCLDSRAVVCFRE